MPGVLIELGFLSNNEEGEYLNSDDGQSEMARQIANSIIHYKKEYFNEPYNQDEVKPVVKTYKPEPKAAIDITSEPNDTLAKVDPVVPGQGLYKIQLFATSKKRDLYSNDFKGLKDISFTFENNLYRYYFGKSYDLDYAKKMCNEAKSKGFSSAFIVVFVDGKSSAVK